MTRINVIEPSRLSDKHLGADAAAEQLNIDRINQRGGLRPTHP